MEIIDYVPVIGLFISILGYLEVRFSSIRRCQRRIEQSLAEHIKFANEKINEMYELKGKLEK